MKFTYTKEKAEDIKEQLQINNEASVGEIEFAEDTQSFLTALNSAIIPLEGNS